MSSKDLKGKIFQSRGDEEAAKLERLKEYTEERDEALFSLDEEKIRKFFDEYGISCPEIPAIFWGGVCKAILRITTAPKDVKEVARKILKFYGMSEEIK